MKAARYHSYGSPDAVRVEEVPKPVPRNDEVLIAVRAAAINPLDWHFVRSPLFFRPFVGLREPRDPRLGVDVAGTVEVVGAKVTAFKPGDDVFGACRGALAEFATVSAARIVIKPPKITFEEAASTPVAAQTALQGLRDKAHVQPGQKVLINGAGGGVGTFAVQIAKVLGAHVTGVCSTTKLDTVRSIGADEVIDYTRDDFTKAPNQYDAVMDCVGSHPVWQCLRVIKRNGVYVGIGARPRLRSILAALVAPVVLSPFVSQTMRQFIAKNNQADLTTIGGLIESGKVKPVIDRKYDLTQVTESIRYLAKGHAHGKVVVTM